MRKLATHELERISVEEFKETQKNNIVVVLDGIRSLNNVGSAFRTSDAFLVNKLMLCGITGKPPHRDIQKTALGATDSVEWEYHENTVDILTKLREEGYKIIAVEQTSDTVLLNEFKANSTEKYAYVFGNEVFGVSDEVIEMVDFCLEIPQFGTKHSLNISVSMGVVLWHTTNDFLNQK